MSAAALALYGTNIFAVTRCANFAIDGTQICASGIDAQVMLQVARVQQNTQWCWAACIQMIFAYYGFSISQPRIVYETWGNIVNMPAQPIDIIRDLNKVWIDDRGRRFVARSIVAGNPQMAAQELSMNRPLIIGALGHAMVLSALTYRRNKRGSGFVMEAVVRDPWETRGRRVLTAQEWNSASFLTGVYCRAI